MTDKVQKTKECMYSKDNYTDEDRKVLCDGCKEKCAYAIADVISTNAQNKKDSASDELEKVVEEIVDPTVLSAYGVKEIANRLRRTMIESVSEEQVKESLISKHDNKTCKENGNSLTEEPASEDLEKEVYEHLWKGRMGTDVSKPIYFSYDELLEVARHFAAWQKQQMMNNAITAEYWDNSLMLDAEMRGKYSDGNKVKLVIIKED